MNTLFGRDINSVADFIDTLHWWARDCDSAVPSNKEPIGEAYDAIGSFIDDLQRMQRFAEDVFEKELES